MHDLYIWYLNTVGLPIRQFIYNVVTAIDIILRYILFFIMCILHSIDLIHIPLIILIIGGGLTFIIIYAINDHRKIPQLVKNNSRDSHLLNDVIFARKVFEPDEQKHTGVFENKLRKRLKTIIIKDIMTIIIAVIVVLGISTFTPKSSYSKLKEHHDYYSESIYKYRIVADDSLTFVGLMLTNDHFNADPESRMIGFVNHKYPNNAITLMASSYTQANDIVKKNGKDKEQIKQAKETIAKIKKINQDINRIYNNTNNKKIANKEIYNKYGTQFQFSQLK